MRFNFFASTEPHSHPTSAPLTAVEEAQRDTERMALTKALYALLESLPQSLAGKDYMRHLCDTVLDATPRLRLVWIGFCNGDEDRVAPHAAAGECIVEAHDWHLPQACFDYAAPYAQAALESRGSLNELNSLFAPWLDDMDACSVHAALAIPLRSEKPDVRGLVVFYADDVNYFSSIGIAPLQAVCHVAEVVWRQSSLMQMLTQKAQLDPLTGLMNRRKMNYLLKTAVERAEREGEQLSIMILRIEGFNRVNNSFGWNAADALLASFAHEIALQIRPQDRLGRWTGVEFMYVLPRTDRRHAEFLAHGLQAYFLSHPLMIEAQSIPLALHIGIASYTRPGMQLDELLRQANERMLATLPVARDGN